ncbi:MAG: AAA family ATPase [Thermoproteota archaeon]
MSGSGRVELINKFSEFAKEKKKSIKIFDVGKMMFDVAEKLGIEIKENKILDLSPSALNFLRATVFEHIIHECSQYEDVVIATHACFRWRKFLIQAFDFNYLRELNPDMYITVIDSLLSIKLKLESSKAWKGRLSLKDILVWRDEETILTKSIADFQGKPFFVVPFSTPPESLFNLIFYPNTKKAYLSYPITHIGIDPSKIEQKNLFRDKLRQTGLIVFDPYDIEDSNILSFLSGNSKNDFIKLEIDKLTVSLSLDEIKEVEKDIDEQIVSRDYQLIDQSDFIIVYYFSPVMSPGVLSEMAYGFSNNKNIYVVFEGPESPFFKYYSTRIFSNEKDLYKFFVEEGIIENKLD